MITAPEQVVSANAHGGLRTTQNSYLTASSKGPKYTGRTRIGVVVWTYLQRGSYLFLFGTSELDYEYDFDMELYLGFFDTEITKVNHGKSNEMSTQANEPRTRNLFL